ncbi:MAG: chitobiase/beta-hexosaminidase C-terminal domain-containing protein [Treponema sp.]|nr:chitobiase/beta-hexosaminidase C-terminal domain-containing protein [Treponema sp.]
MKQFFRCAALILGAALAFGFVSCEGDVETEYLNKEVKVDKTYASAVAFTVTETSTEGTVSVTMASESTGAKIYYTTDGSTPTTQSTEYTAALTISEDTTFKAIVVKEGIENSPVSIASVSVKGRKVIETVYKTYTSAVTFSVEATVSIKDMKTDVVAPANVTNLAATAKDTCVLLTWTDATDNDVYGYEVSYSGNSAINRTVLPVLDEKSMVVAPGAGGCYVSGLTNGTEYTFTVKSVDTSGNKSAGVTVKATPVAVEGNVMVINLTPSTTSATKENVTVTVQIISDASVKTIKYATGTKPVSYFVTDGTSITADGQGAYTFTASENETFTVFAQDKVGRRETTGITISNIDRTAPGTVTDFKAVYNYSAKTITLSWNEPADSDYAKVAITSGDAAIAMVEKGTKTYTINNVKADGTAYTYNAVSYDAAGNSSAAVSASIFAGLFTITVNDSTNGTVSANKRTAVEGETVTLTATPKTGYKLASLSVKNGETDVSIAAGKKFTMPAGNVTVSATFIPIASEFVTVKGATVSGVVANSEVFIAGRTVPIPDMYVSDHEVTQEEYETYCKYDSDSPSST